MWASTPYYDDLEGVRQNYSDADVACLATRLRALVNILWPGAGVDVTFRLRPDPLGVRLCAELINVPGEDEDDETGNEDEDGQDEADDAENEEKDYGDDVGNEADDGEAGKDEAPLSNSPLATISSDGSSDRISTRGKTEAFAMTEQKGESMVLRRYIEKILETYADAAIAFTAEREGLGVPVWYQLMIMRFQAEKIREYGNSSVLGHVKKTSSPLANARALNFVAQDPVCGADSPLHWFVHKSAYDPELPLRILQFMRTLYRSGTVVCPGNVAEKFGLDIIHRISQRADASVLARPVGATESESRGKPVDPRPVLISIAVPV